MLEAEIEVVSAKAATGDLSAVMRKGALETKLLVRQDRGREGGGKGGEKGGRERGREGGR